MDELIQIESEPHREYCRKRSADALDHCHFMIRSLPVFSLLPTLKCISISTNKLIVCKYTTTQDVSHRPRTLRSTMSCPHIGKHLGKASFTTYLPKIQVIIAFATAMAQAAPFAQGTTTFHHDINDPNAQPEEKIDVNKTLDRPLIIGCIGGVILCWLLWCVIVAKLGDKKAGTFGQRMKHAMFPCSKDCTRGCCGKRPDYA